MSTEISTFAQAVLFSADIEMKLANPGALTDEQRGTPIAVPLSPGRPDFYQLKSIREIPLAPTSRAIVDEHVRGTALHSFAHHELQALELMALMLLRFPSAPPAFRHGLVDIMKDEQRHFSLYRDRAEVYGVGLGDVGASHLFWDTVAHLKTLPELLAALSLTYEQANLDFGLYWRDAFAGVDDQRSAKVFGLVHADEMGHVAHGVRWFEEISGPLTFAAYERQLTMPLTPARGKGPIFNRKGRVVAGFSTAFIDEMEVVSHSKGRPPRVFQFDPFVEEDVAGRTVPKRVRGIAMDLASLPMFLAKRDDVVVAPKPSPSVLLPLQNLGFPIPQFVTDRASLKDRKLGEEMPWGVGPTHDKWQPGFEALFDKRVAQSMAVSFVEAHQAPNLAKVEGGIASSLAEVRDLIPTGDWVIKAPFSASGQHRIRGEGLLAERAVSWVERQLKLGAVVVQPWHERVLDLSTQVVISDDAVEVLGHTRFWTDKGGVYRGSLVGSWATGLDSPLARALHGGGKGSDTAQLLTASARFVGQWAQSLGYRGPLGIDAMVILIDGVVKLRPILEVNPRFTMGRIALEMSRQVPGCGAWYLLRDREIERAGYENRSALIRRIAETEGVYFTTDPTAASQVVSVLVLAKRWAAASALWQDLGFEDYRK
jgi:uncharacterized ferritin-like protein (DUF455 family)